MTTAQNFKYYVFGGALGLSLLTWFFVGVPWDIYTANWIYFSSLAQGPLALLVLLWLLGLQPISTLFLPAVLWTLSFAPIAFLVLFGLWGGQESLFYWTRSETDSAWLSVPFLFGRHLVSLLFFYGVTVRLFFFYLRDRKKNHTLLISFFLLFLLNQGLVAIDFGMTLFPHWHSTLFSLYFSFGGLYTGLGVLMLLLSLSKRVGAQPDLWQVLCRLLLTFPLIWFYLWVARFVPTWYANLPDETGPLYLHISGDYVFLSLLMIVFLFLFPFGVRLFGSQNPKTLNLVLAMVLIGCWIERYLIVIPPVRQLNSGALSPSWVSGLTTLGFFAAFFLIFSLATKRLKTLSSGAPLPSSSN